MTTPDNDGWIKWSGGECPLADGTAHEVRFRGGGEFDDDHPETWEWRHLGASSDIIAYRVVKS